MLGGRGGEVGIDRRLITGAAWVIGGFLAVVVLAQVVLPALSGRGAVPSGLYLRGAVVGLLNALLAVGLVLIYRSNRIVNFAQGELGAFAAVLASELYQVFHWPYAAAIGVSIVAALAASLAVNLLVIRRFERSPRLILTVATIGVAQILGAIELAIPYFVNRNRPAREFRTSLTTPFDASFLFGDVRFTGDHIVVLLLGPLILAGLAYFLTRTRYGVAARAVAENEERSRLLGVRVKRISLIVWGIAGVLSALTAILRAPVVGFQFGAIGGGTLLLRALAAGVIGRMENLPVTALAAVLLTIAEQSVYSTYLAGGPTDGFYLVVVVVALLVQHRRLARAEVSGSSWQAVQAVRPVPLELRSLPEVRTVALAVGGVVIALLVALPYAIGTAATNLAAVTVLYAMVGVSLVILTGWSGNVSLGQWAIVGFGAFTAGRLATLAQPQDFFLTLIAGGLAGAAVSVVVGLPALRIRGLFLGVTTLALAIASTSWFFQFEAAKIIDPIVRPVLFGLVDASGTRAYYYVCLAGLAFAIWAARNVRRARLGRVLIAMRDNETHALALGMRPVRNKLVSFAVSGFVAALAGGLFAYHQGALRADRFGAEISLQMFSMVVIGGMGSLAGAVLGAVYVFGVQYFLPQQLQLFATGFGMLLLLLWFPGGLGQVVNDLRDAYLRRVADRRGLVVPSLVADKAAEWDPASGRTEPAA